MGERSILFSGMTVCALLDSRANDEIRTRPMEARPPDCIPRTLRTMALSASRCERLRDNYSLAFLPGAQDVGSSSPRIRTCLAPKNPPSMRLNHDHANQIFM